jgi:Mg-chelatase subunit ChlD
MTLSTQFNAVYQTANSYTSYGYHKSVAWITGKCSQAYSQCPPIYQTASSYTSYGYHKSIAWITGKYSQAYSQCPAITAAVRRHGWSSFNAGRSWLWAQKYYVLGGTALVVAWVIVRYIRKNRPQPPPVRKEPIVEKPKFDMPRVSLASTLDTARLDIEIPQGIPAPPNVTLTFCIDTSGSMDVIERSGAVKKGIRDVLDSAEQIVNTRGAQISLAIIGFDSSATVIIPITKITRAGSGASAVQPIKDQLERVRFNGATDIIRGLSRGAEELIAMSQTHRGAFHTIVLLTDGDDKVDGRLDDIHKVLAKASAKLFAIGIGQEHKKETLEQIANGRARGVNGTYIDTTVAGNTIEGAISTIYNQAIASFREFQLTAPSLSPNAWSVVNVPKKDGEPQCDLGSLAEGSTITRHIRIHGEKLKAPLELSTVAFSLSFIDSKGQQGSVSLPWNPNTVVNPAILAGLRT